MQKKINFEEMKWINQPDKFEIKDDKVIIETNPGTDYWQRTYYNFQNDNAHTYVFEVSGGFSFTIKTEFESKKMFDQCGVVMYQDSDNWFKASIEYEDEKKSKLGSVVTNLGYSDWATTDISSADKTMWYRLSRRGQDFLIENSTDGKEYKQMRIFHMHKEIDKARIGIYACSPLESSSKAEFSEVTISECMWEEHKI